MRIPDGLTSLVEHGVVDEVVRSLKSGKEAQVYLVSSGGEYRVAKVYKDADERNFQNRAVYTEGRQVRNSRDQRAMAKGSKHGKAQNEAAWKSAEVDMIYRLSDAGVRVPKPHFFIDGTLIMELVVDAEGQPAPRLGEVHFTPEEAQAAFTQLLAEAVRMLSAGVVHGDLSEFNVLVAHDGPVLIDFPQAVSAASNQNARKLLLRDIENLKLFLRRFVPTAPLFPYAEEMWQLYERGELTAATQLTGKYDDHHKKANTGAVLDLIEDARRDERFRRQALGRNLRGLGGQPDSAPRGAKPEQHRQAPASQPQQPRPSHPQGQQRPQHQHPNGNRPQQHSPRPHPNQATAPRPQHGAVRPHQHGAARPHQHDAARPQQHDASRPRQHDAARAQPHSEARPPHNAPRPQHPSGARPQPHGGHRPQQHAQAPRAQSGPPQQGKPHHQRPHQPGRPHGGAPSRPRPEPRAVVVETKPLLPGLSGNRETGALRETPVDGPGAKRPQSRS